MHNIDIHTLWLIPFFPLLGAVIAGLFGRKLPKWVVTVVSPGVILASFVTVVLHVEKLARFQPDERRLLDVVYPLMRFAGVNVDVAFVLDPLSSVMTLVITGVGFLIHLYSVGYMGHDKSYHRYFAYLNLFVFAMLLLVMGANLIVMFVGWEGVGLCSYLLIGFWFEEKANSDAGKKAFIVNRIGDFGFLLGTFLVFYVFRSFDFQVINETILQYGAKIPPIAFLFIALFLFVGATGKSAQIPLYVWLPDAMAGPTPVSALIHAATMVTAGVYMIARLNLIFFLAPGALHVIAWVGAATALFAASIGLVQNDIKKVLAYSTVSQLGFMFVAMGVGAWTAGIFHLMTHAFFKACLFLGSGSVIHAMGGEQDIRKMGGLKKWMPITYLTFLIATLAIAGIPPFAGFFSKDEILWRAFGSAYGSTALWATVSLAALFTAFYMTRLVILTFWGENRSDEHTREHLHESPLTITIPLVVLAVLSLIGGYFNVPEAMLHHLPSNIFTFFAPVDVLEHWLEPVLGLAPAVGLRAGAEEHESALVWGSIAVALTGMGTAYLFYMVKPAVPKALAGLARGVPYRLVLNKYYVDEIYDATVVKPIFYTSVYVLWQFVDKIIIDGLVNGAARAARFVSDVVRRFQTGDVQAYAFSMVVGLLVMFGYFVYGWWS
jgi:NADH-quinone oxidoreductase subunit L